MRRVLFLTLASVLTISFIELPACAQAPSQSEGEQPPAKKITRIKQGGNITAKMLTFKVKPKYAAKAREQRIQGTVRLHVILAKDGTVQQIEVMSGDSVLAQAALDAVRQWKYRVALLNGEPVEVDTTVDVIFSLVY
jgi:protein TonB